MTKYAKKSGVVLTDYDASHIKGMLARKDRMHDIAAYFGVNSARIAEIKNGTLFPDTERAPVRVLPPSGPYATGREVHQAVQLIERSLAKLKQATFLGDDDA